MPQILQKMFQQCRHEGRILYVTKVRHGRISVVSHKTTTDPTKAKKLQQAPFTEDFPGYWEINNGVLFYRTTLPEGVYLANNTKLYHFVHKPEMDTELNRYIKHMANFNVGSPIYLPAEDFENLQDLVKSEPAEPTESLIDLMESS